MRRPRYNTVIRFQKAKVRGVTPVTFELPPAALANLVNGFHRSFRQRHEGLFHFKPPGRNAPTPEPVTFGLAILFNVQKDLVRLPRIRDGNIGKSVPIKVTDA